MRGLTRRWPPPKTAMQKKRQAGTTAPAILTTTRPLPLGSLSLRGGFRFLLTVHRTRKRLTISEQKRRAMNLARLTGHADHIRSSTDGRAKAAIEARGPGPA